MLPSIKNLNCDHKKVLIRVDFNVPLDEEKNVVDTTRLEAAHQTIDYVLQKGGSVILMSHLGRPKGKVNPDYSLKYVLSDLEKILKTKVLFASDCIGEIAKNAKKDLQPGQILLLENLRFHPGEEKPAKDPHFAQELAQYADCYVNEAFSCSHREHSSITEVPKHIKESAFGFEQLNEIEAYERYLEAPKRPFVALVGGAKISSKISALRALLSKVDTLLIGGAMAHTFYAAQGLPVGNSLYEPELEEEAEEILRLAKEKKVPLILPRDIGVFFEASSALQYLPSNQLPSDGVGVDIGPQTLLEFKKVLEKGQTIFWNGPLGIFEEEESAKGTLEIARFLANVPGITFVGGGDSTAALHQAGVEEKMTFVSTGGGASLELIEKGSLPGIQCLLQKKV